MMDVPYTSHPTGHGAAVVDDATRPGRRTRVSWGGIFAGALLAVVLQSLLTMLGVGIGLVSTENLSGADSLGIGAGIWWIISAVVALAIGGWIAAHLAAPIERTDGILHGLVVWAVAALLGAWLATTIAGNVLGGIWSAAGNAMQLAGDVAGSGVQAAGTAMQPAVRQAGQAVGSAGQQVGQQVQQMLREAGLTGGQGGLSPEQAAQKARDVGQKLQQYATGQGGISREEVVSLLASETQLSRQEAGQRVDQLQRAYQQAQQMGQQAQQEVQETAQQAAQQAQQMAQQAGQQARQAAESAWKQGSDVVGQAAIWSAIVLLLGGIAAGAGGGAGVPKRERVRTTQRPAYTN